MVVFDCFPLLIKGHKVYQSTFWDKDLPLFRLVKGHLECVSYSLYSAKLSSHTQVSRTRRLKQSRTKTNQQLQQLQHYSPSDFSRSHANNCSQELCYPRHSGGAIGMTMVYDLIISNEQSIPSGQTHSGIQSVINAFVAIDPSVSFNSETLNPLSQKGRHNTREVMHIQGLY